MNLIIKDAVRQILGRVASAVGGFIVIKLITPYLGPLRFGDYSTILKYFAIWSAFADFGLYVIAMKQLGEIKKSNNTEKLKTYYNKFVSSRVCMIAVVYSTALLISFFIPTYTSNPYLVRGLPLGMIFSATFMGAGIIQIPLQLFRKMKHLSVGLILARVAQLIVLVSGIYFIFPNIDFTSEQPHIIAFLCILLSVVASGLTQGIYVYYIGRKDLPIQRSRDRTFTKKLLTSNRKYGVAYYLSSFHTLIVLILLSIFFPTVEGRTYVGIYGLALSLIEILLIVPSALGNSMMHDIGQATRETKRKRFGTLAVLVSVVGIFVILNFWHFSPHIINFLGGSDYLTSGSTLGSDFVLPFLGGVIFLSFLKQVCNYLFVSTKLHNKLLGINLFGVFVGVGIGVPLILNYNLIGGIITQILLEVLFVIGAFYVATKNDALPIIRQSLSKELIRGIALLFVLFVGSKEYLLRAIDGYIRIAGAILLNISGLALFYIPLKKILNKL